MLWTFSRTQFTAALLDLNLGVGILWAGGSETEVSVSGGKKLTERKANFLFSFEYFTRPGESEVVSEFCAREHWRT